MKQLIHINFILISVTTFLKLLLAQSVPVADGGWQVSFSFRETGDLADTTFHRNP